MSALDLSAMRARDEAEVSLERVSVAITCAFSSLLEVRLVVGVLIVRRDPAEPRDLDVELLPVRRTHVDTLKFAAVIRDPLLVSRRRLTAWRRRPIAELDSEACERVPLRSHGLRDYGV